MVDAVWHRGSAIAVIAGLLGLQRLVGVHATGEAKLLIGHVLSLALCAAVMELGSPTLCRWFIKPSATANVNKPARVYVLLTLLLVVSAFSRDTARFFALLPSSPPTIPLAVLVGLWIAFLVRVVHKGFSNASMAVALVGLAVGARVLNLGTLPFHRLDGDMLATIDRGLEELMSGRFPYANFPPPMPYLPGTFLAYLPAKLLGVDLRWANIVLDAMVVVATIHLARRLANRSRAGHAASAGSGPLLNQLLLPCLMLHPVWIQYGVNTQYSPSLLVTLLLGFSVLFGNHLAQAVALGLAVGSNQMLGACGPILFAHWLGRFGPRRATGLALLAAAVFLLILAPFLLWEPRRFIEVAFLSRNRFDDALMAGRFTLLPLASRLVPRGSRRLGGGPRDGLMGGPWFAKALHHGRGHGLRTLRRVDVSARLLRPLFLAGDRTRLGDPRRPGGRCRADGTKAAASWESGEGLPEGGRGDDRVTNGPRPRRSASSCPFDYNDQGWQVGIFRGASPARTEGA